MNRKQINRKRIALIALTLTLCLAVGCAARASRPTVTQDDLTPFSVVTEQDGAASDAPARDYAYFWEGEDIEASAARLRDELTRTHAVSMTEADAGEVFSGLSEEDITDGMIEEHFAELVERNIDTYRAGWEAQHALNPTFSPQEAANRAGRVFEALYGLDLTDETLRLCCYTSDGSGTPNGPAVGGGVLRTLWEVSLQSDAPDGAGAFCTLDATTGEFVSCRFLWDEEMLSAARATQPADCFVLTENNSVMMRGYWDETAPSFEATVNALLEEAAAQLSASALTGGAAVTAQKAVLADRSRDGDTLNNLLLYFTCENGNTYLLQRHFALDPYIRYDFQGHPLCAYTFYNDSYWQ